MSKKNVVFILVLSLVLSLTACGKKSNITPENEGNRAPNTADITDNTPEESNDTDTDSKELPKDSEQVSDSDASVDNSSENFSSEMATEENAVKADDGTEVFTSLISYPEVSIPSNEYAQMSINDFFTARVASWKEEEAQIGSDALESYEYAKESEDDYFMPYFYQVIGSEENTAKGLYSVLMTYSYFTGGAHPNSFYEGYNFDLSTGELLDIGEIASDEDSFRDFLVNTLITDIKEGKNMGSDLAEDLFFEDYADSIRNTINGTPLWYTTKDSLVICFNTYEIAPYVAGPIFFDIPWNDCKDYLSDDFKKGLDL
jgi:hypothetical protein